MIQFPYRTTRAASPPPALTVHLCVPGVVPNDQYPLELRRHMNGVNTSGQPTYRTLAQTTYPNPNRKAFPSFTSLTPARATGQPKKQLILD